ncbi:hypothetical protein WMF31_06170 [Sorangium sp. So ce1036]|jgi:photosystem II stability/assembly factor-like uncharacterized protein|uniref:WD40/YVTN/BNR-like repeat-containing protein n=1 Tax=Sorangium sp. So ce1036 TaxID=3133328 RepID=UPI003F0385DF
MIFPSSNRIALGLRIALASAALAASTPASANGRYPSAGQILVDPADPRRIVLRATYGVLTTSDGGERWSWICEESIGYSGFEDPMLVITGDGSILAGLSSGLSATHDRGCQWDIAGGGLADLNLVDVSIDRAEPSSAILLGSSVLTGDEILTQVWASKDDGRTWAQAGVDLPSAFLGVTLDSAPSDPRRLYVSGRWNGPTFQGALQRSDDRGETWESFDIPGSDDRNLPYLGAVDPRDADVVYVRRDGDGADALLVSKDGGATWREVFHAVSLLGFALSPDGARIAVGSDMDGLWIAPTTTLEFTQVGRLGVRCLTWTSDGLFACADELADGFTAGVSVDGGETFSPILTLDRLCGPPPACGRETSTGATCPALWAATASFLGVPGRCDAGAGPSAGASGGDPAAGGASTGTGVGTGAPGAGGGCACDASGQGRPGALLSCMIAAGGALLGARRRRARGLRLRAREPRGPV